MLLLSFFFFNDTATTEIYTLSLHDALPISAAERVVHLLRAEHRGGQRADDGLSGERAGVSPARAGGGGGAFWDGGALRSEEHTSELQSQSNLVCRLLLEKKKNTRPRPYIRC